MCAGEMGDQGGRTGILEEPGLGWGIPEEQYPGGTETLKRRGLLKYGHPRGMGTSKEQELGGGGTTEGPEL